MSKLEYLKNECNLLSDSEKESLIEYLKSQSNISFIDTYQSNCKHYNTQWSPMNQIYKCRDCGKWDVSTENDRWK